MKGLSAMKKDNSSNDKWLEAFYGRVNDQFVLSRTSQQNTHHWVISLALALIAAVLTLGGNEKPYPSEFNFVAVLVSLPLMFRFFVRSCLETSIQNRWLVIRNALDEYNYIKSNNEDQITEYREYLNQVISLYYFRWKSPTKIGKIVWDNIRLAYFWPFIVIIILLIWGYIALPLTRMICVASIVVSSFMIFEIVTFLYYKGFKYEEAEVKKPNIRFN
ncbi:MAG: hypothetical protein JW870_13375 [Candidatus Delongbacteria bacterium]|nr:hypothetical protein [Candidatus Delongbacteria bacterium]